MKGNQTQQGTTGNQNDAGTMYQNASGQAQGQPNYNQQAPQGAPVGGQRQGAGISALFSRGGPLPMGGAGAGRDLSELTKKLQDYYEQQKSTELGAWDVRIVPVSRGSVMGAKDNYTNHVGMILFIVTKPDAIAYHTLLLQSEMGPAPARTNDMYNQYNQEQLTMPRTPSILADDALAAVIKERVSQLYPQTKSYSADWSTVPQDFPIADQHAIGNVFLNSLKACAVELQTHQPGFAYDSLSTVAGDGLLINSVHVNQDHTNTQIEVYDVMGNPIRDEVMTDFRSEQPQQRGANRDNTENTAGVMELGRTLAYVSLNIDPSAGRLNRQMGFAGNQQQNQQDTQEYVAEVTISGFDLAITPDLGNVLLQLSTTFPLIDTKLGRPWVRAFLPRHLQQQGAGGRHGEHFRPRDLGALNYDYGVRSVKPGTNEPIVAPFPTTDEKEFLIDNFWNLVGAIIHPQAALSIDVPLAGPDTWFMRAFAEASELPAAYDAIVRAMDALTDGRFSQHFFAQGSSRLIVLPQAERVWNGYFIDDAGRKHDLREVDMLYLLNAKGHQYPNIGKDWASTFGGSSDAQMATRAKIISDTVNAKFTGMSVHKTFHPDFIRAADLAIGETGLRPRVDISNPEGRMQMRQAYGLAQSGALATNFHSTMYTTGPSYTSNSAGYRGMSHTRQY